MKYNRASYKLLPLKHIKYNLKMLVIVLCKVNLIHIVILEFKYEGKIMIQ